MSNYRRFDDTPCFVLHTRTVLPRPLSSSYQKAKKNPRSVLTRDNDDSSISTYFIYCYALFMRGVPERLGMTHQCPRSDAALRREPCARACRSICRKINGKTPAFAGDVVRNRETNRGNFAKICSESIVIIRCDFPSKNVSSYSCTFIPVDYIIHT